MSEGHRKNRSARFDTIDDVVTEMKVIYRLTRRGEIEVEEASKLFQMLKHILAGLEVVELERRVEALEMHSP